MEPIITPSRPKRARSTADSRAALLAAFEQSGLSAPAFARQQGIPYSTFAAWRRRQRRSGSPAPGPGFVEISVDPPAAPAPSASAVSAGLVLELGAGARLRLTSADQLPLAVQLLRAWEEGRPC